MVKIKELESYKDFGRAVSISNGVVEAVVTIDLGPRIIYFGFLGGQNFMCDDHVALGKKEDEEYWAFFGEDKKWRSFGGHRVWVAPESYPETYTPDDQPVEYTVTDSGAVFKKADDTLVGTATTLEVIMDPDDTNLQVVMTVKNISEAPKDFAVWSLSVCDKNGVMVIPMNKDDTGLLPNRKLSLWPYTDLSDKRLFFGKDYITVAQDPKAENPLKIGVDLNCGTAFYILNDEILCKHFDTNHPDGNYVDGGCSFETYTNSQMLEFETLGELKTVAAGESLEHSERWFLVKKPCEVDTKDDASIGNLLSKI